MARIHPFVTSLLLTGLSLGSVNAVAQGRIGAGPTPSPARTLDDIVVTGTRTEKSRIDAPVRTEVVDRAELEATGASTLKDALANVPGLQIQDLASGGGGGGGKSGFRLIMQGLSSDQVLVLIDGLPIAASTNSTVDLAQYLLSDVERVEVVKGAASAQYGSAAMGGVVNVITRAPRAGLRGAAGVGVGTRGRQNHSGKRVDDAIREYQAELEGGTARLRGRLALDRLDDDGFAVNPAGWARQGDRIRRQQVSGKLAFTPAEGTDLGAEFSHYQEKDLQRYEQFRPPRIVPLHKTEDIDRDRLVLRGRHRLAHGSVVDVRGLSERYDSVSRNHANGILQVDRSSRQKNEHLSLQWDLPPLPTQAWQWGLDLHRENLDQRQNGAAELTGDGVARRSSHELFLQGDVFVTPAWEVVGGVRWQDDSDFGGHWAPKLALRGRLLEVGERTLTLRASVGTGYRVPNLKERHYLFDHSALGYMVVGNPQLKPESSTGMQLGLVLAQGADWSLDVNAWRNRVSDLIEVDRNNSRDQNGIAVYTYRNVARARTQGVETVASWQPSSTWRLSAAVTFTSARNLVTGGELTQRPRRMARFGADWQMWPGTTLTTRLRHQSRELSDSSRGLYSDAWTTVDLMLRQRISRQLSVWLQADNLFHEQRNFAQDHQFGPISGRMLMLGIRYGEDLARVGDS